MQGDTTDHRLHELIVSLASISNTTRDVHRAEHHHFNVDYSGHICVNESV